MAKTTITNQADFSGVYGTEAEPITFMTNLVTTTIVRGLTATMTADKNYWVDGPLLYTVTVTNSSGEDYKNGVLADLLDTTNTVFDEEYGVTINGAKTTDFTYSGGNLSVNLPDLADGATLTVTFRVTQA